MCTIHITHLLSKCTTIKNSERNFEDNNRGNNHRNNNYDSNDQHMYNDKNPGRIQ